MKTKELNAGSSGQKTYVLIFDSGDEFTAGIFDFASQKDLKASHFTAIGGFQSVTLGYFDIETKTYQHIPINEQVEVLSLIGDIALNQSGKPQVHAHVVVGKRDGTAWGGHIIKAQVRPTLEVVLTETPAELERKTDPNTGLALINV